MRPVIGGSRFVRLSVYFGAVGREQLLSGEYAPVHLIEVHGNAKQEAHFLVHIRSIELRYLDPV